MAAPKVEDILARFKGRPVADLEAAFRKRIEENQGIQLQLSDKDKRHPDGSRYTDHEYHEWRGRAIAAWKHGVAEQRVMKEALKIARRRFNTDTPLRNASDLTTPDALIHAAYVVLHRMASEGVEVDEEEQRIIDALDAYLRNNGKVEATPVDEKAIKLRVVAVYERMKSAGRRSEFDIADIMGA